MKPTPTSRTHSATLSGPRSIFTPSASSTSALPHALEAARFPCFATRPPAPAVTTAASVEMLMLLERSPPVPTTSIAPSATDTRTACARIAVANPAISSAVSPRMCSAARSAASCAGVASPAMTELIVDSASSRVSERPPATTPSASRASTEVLQHAHAVGFEHGLRVELDGLEWKRGVPQAHDHAVVRPRRDDELGRQGRLVDHQGVIARRLSRKRHPREDALAIVAHQAGLAVARLRRPYDARTERDGDTLEAETYAQRRDAECRCFAHQRGRPAGGLGPAPAW